LLFSQDIGFLSRKSGHKGVFCNTVARSDIFAPSVLTLALEYLCIRHLCTMLNMVCQIESSSTVTHIIITALLMTTLSLPLTQSFQLLLSPRNPEPIVLPSRLRPSMMLKLVITLLLLSSTIFVFIGTCFRQAA